MKARVWIGDRLSALGLYTLLYATAVALFAVAGLYRFAGLAAPIVFLVCLLYGDRLLAWFATPSEPAQPSPESRGEAVGDPVRAAVTAALFEMPVSDLLLSGKVAEVASAVARQACAQQILDHAERHVPPVNNAQKRLRRHLRLAASIVNPQPAPITSPAEPKEAA